VAIGNDREVGVDVEQVRPDAAIDEIAAEYFSPREQAAIHRLPPADRDRAGFACWTLKEAYLKARGGGLDRPLDDFDVLDAQTGTGSGYGVSSVAAVDGWSLRLLQLGDEYAGAVAAAGTGPPLPATPRRLSLADLTTG
jgi:4'-phosphopantetheinyl transferase